MEPYLINAGVAGFGYAVAALLAKKALQNGFGVLRLSFVMNLTFVGVFALVFVTGADPIPIESIHLPVFAGTLFFLGQLFTFAAIRFGDVSLQTPVMGTKAVFVVIIAILLGTEPVDAATGAAAVLAAVAVALLGFSGGGAQRVGLTLVLALLSALFFAGSDTMVGHFGRDYGVKNFLFLAVLINGILSFGLIPFFQEPLRKIPRPVWKWAFAGAVVMAGQALLLNYTLAAYQNVPAVNVVYSSRGLWSVVLAAPLAFLFAMPREVVSRKDLLRRFCGALLITVAIALIFG